MKRLYILFVLNIIGLSTGINLFSSETVSVNSHTTTVELQSAIVETLNTIGRLLTKYNEEASQKVFDEISQHIKILKKQNIVAFQNLSNYCKAFFDNKNAAQVREEAYNHALSFIRTFNNKVFASATDQLQKNIVNLEEQEVMLAQLYEKIDILVKQKIVTQEEAALQKKQLKTIVDTNKAVALKQASYVNRLSAAVKSPFKWAYNKVFDQDASYLQRAAYATIIAVGTVAIGAGLYYGLSSVKDWWNVPPALPETTKVISQEQQVKLPLKPVSEVKQESIVSNEIEKGLKPKEQVSVQGQELAAEIKNKEELISDVESKKVIPESESVTQVPASVNEELKEELKEAEYEEFQKFVRRFAPPQKVQQTIEANKEKLEKNGYVPLKSPDDASYSVYAKGDDIERIMNSYLLSQYFKEKNYPFTAAEKYLAQVNDEWRVFAEYINPDETPESRHFTPEEKEMLKQTGADTGYSDWSAGNLIKRDGKIYFIDTEAMSFRRKDFKDAIKYNKTDIDFEKVKDQLEQIKSMHLKKQPKTEILPSVQTPEPKVKDVVNLETSKEFLQGYANTSTMILNDSYGQPGSSSWIEKLTKSGYSYNPTTNTMETDTKHGHYIYDINTKAGKLIPK